MNEQMESPTLFVVGKPRKSRTAEGCTVRRRKIWSTATKSAVEYIELSAPPAVYEDALRAAGAL